MHRLKSAARRHAGRIGTLLLLLSLLPMLPFQPVAAQTTEPAIVTYSLFMPVMTDENPKAGFPAGLKSTAAPTTDLLVLERRPTASEKR